MIALGLAGVLSIGSLGAYQAAALPINAATMKAAVPSDITDVRGGARVGGVRAGGYRAAGVRAGGYRPWGAAAAGAALGAAAAGAAYYNQPYYYGQQCGYYPYPPCY